MAFDLIVEECEKIFGENNSSRAYYELEKFFVKNNNFEHLQGSVYCSNEYMLATELIFVLEQLKKACPWLSTCLRKMNVSRVEDIHEVTEIFIESTVIEDIELN